MKLRTFHQETGAHTLTEKRVVLEMRSPSMKAYPRFPSQRLPDPTLPEMSLGTIVRERRSARTFDTEKHLSQKELSNILYAAAGITAEEDGLVHRTYPSGGALQPTEHYLLIERVEKMEPGLYHYDAHTHSCTHLTYAQQIPPNSLWDGLAPIENPAATIIITSVWNRVYQKYGEFSYRLALAEAGHSAQNALLASTAHSIGSCPIMGFDETKVRALLDITHDDEDPLYLVCIGHTK